MKSLADSFKLKTYFCFILIFLADWLFFKHILGWTLGLFSTVLLSIFLFHNNKVLNSKAGKIISVLLIGLCLELIYNPNDISIPLTFFGFVSLALIAKKQIICDFFGFCKSLSRFLGALFQRPFAMLGLYKVNYKKPKFKSNFFSNWLLALIFSIVFIFLLAKANPLIQNYFNKVDSEFWLELFNPWRFIFLLSIGIFCWSIIRPKILPQKNKILISRQASEEQSETGFWLFLFNKNSILRSLILFNLIFAIQTFMDIIYLWGGRKLPIEFTYAEYAHRGAYPLIFTALLAGLFVLLALRPNSQTEKQFSIRALVYAWVAQNIFLVISSIWRTHLYAEVYGLTRLRIAAFIWMALVAFGLALIIWRILRGRTNIWLLNANALTLISVLYISSFMNFNDLIAKTNAQIGLQELKRNTIAADLDFYYLEDLGIEALPYLSKYCSALKPISVKEKLCRNTRNGKICETHIIDDSTCLEIEDKLKAKLGKSLADWRGWTLKRHLLSESLSKGNICRL